MTVGPSLGQLLYVNAKAHINMVCVKQRKPMRGRKPKKRRPTTGLR